MRHYYLTVTIAVVALCLFFSTYAYAQSPSSPNYRVDESSFNSGSEVDASSTNYSGRASIGDVGSGYADSGNYASFAGFINPDEEYVELIVPADVIDMGTLDPGTPGTGTATFSARAYLNDNYIIVSPRDPPTSENGEIIDPITTAAAFDSSTEQFGINLVANTSPVTQGAAPAHQPDSNYAYGEAAPGYNTANNYQYNAGDIIARSVTRGWGETDYTISYLLNVTSITSAGQYRMEQDLVITATY